MIGLPKVAELSIAEPEIEAEQSNIETETSRERFWQPFNRESRINCEYLLGSYLS